MEPRLTPSSIMVGAESSVEGRSSQRTGTGTHPLPPFCTLCLALSCARAASCSASRVAARTRRFALFFARRRMLCWAYAPARATSRPTSHVAARSASHVAICCTCRRAPPLRTSTRRQLRTKSNAAPLAARTLSSIHLIQVDCLQLRFESVYTTQRRLRSDETEAECPSAERWKVDGNSDSDMPPLVPDSSPEGSEIAPPQLLKAPHE